MKIMIIGCGKVGFTLARQLSGENHELVLLDHRAEAMQVADSSLDLMCVEGSGASIQTLREAGVKDTELVVAVTGSEAEHRLLPHRQEAGGPAHRGPHPLPGVLPGGQPPQA